MVRVRLSNLALLDLKDIVDYIKRDSIKYAYSEKKKIEERIDKLAEQPLSGKPFGDMDSEHVRELVFRNYRIIYEIASSEKIIILTIHHHARLLLNNMDFDDED